MSDQNSTGLIAGRRYRMTAEVTVTNFRTSPDGLYKRAYVHGEVFPDNDELVDPSEALWELLPEPEPDWQPGDVARTEGGIIVMRQQDSLWHWVAQSGIRIEDKQLSRPLTPLVLGGKPVTS